MTLRILGGAFKGRILKTPPEKITRPTQGILKQAVFNICQEEVQNAQFLDLFAGSGAIGLEALSRGALHVSFVEKNRDALSCIRENIIALNVSLQTHIFPMDALSAIKKMTEPFTIIYIDPPYDTNVKQIVDHLAEKNLISSFLFIEEREKSHTSLEHPLLKLYDKRRYGIALLSIFQRV